MGDGDIRLTVWQNLLLSGVAGRESPMRAPPQALGLGRRSARASAPASSPARQPACKFAASTPSGTPLEIADHIEAAVALETPVNIHLTGCPHSCAQHYIGDIG